MNFAQDHHLVDIDMLFDLRYSLAVFLDREKFNQYIKDELYFERDSDRYMRKHFGYDEQAWYDLYTTHFKEIFKETFATGLVGLLIPLTNRADDVQRPTEKGLKRLTVNFPYGLPDKDILEQIEEYLKSIYYGYYEDIFFTTMQHKHMKLSELKRTYTDYFCYNWSKWMEYNYENIRDQLSPNFRLHAPELRPPGDLEYDERQKKDMGEMNPFDLVTYIHIPNMSICWLPKEVINMHLPQGEEKGEA